MMTTGMKRAVAAVATAAALGLAAQAQAQEKFLGEIMLVGYTFCPRGTAEASGQLLAISQNTALFSLYGTTYGGDGRTTFALPDLRGRVPIHAGQGPGTSNYPLGARGGAETQTLAVQQLPPHTHPATGRLNASGSPATSPAPAGNLPALAPGGAIYGAVPPGGSTQAMAADGVAVTVGAAGGGQPVSVVQPYQTLRYCVVLQGIFPSRS